MKFRDKDFSGEEIVLDGNTFTGCTFRNCRVIYRASAGITMTACHFKENIEWDFDGHAAATLATLADFYHFGGKGGREMVEKTFENIRRRR